MADLTANPKLCMNCGAPDSVYKCACKVGYYCGKKCQLEDWAKHKTKCIVVLSRDAKKEKREHGKDSFEVAEALMKKGRCDRDDRRYAQSEKSYLEAIRIFTLTVGASHASTGEAYRRLGHLYKFQEKFEEGMECFEKGLGIMREPPLTMFDPQGCFHHKLPGQAACLADIGLMHVTFDRFDEAHAKYEEAHEIYRACFGSGADHEQVARLIGYKADLYTLQGKLKEAEEAYIENIRMLRATVGVDEDPEGSVADALTFYGNVFLSQGKYVEARAQYEEGLAMLRRVHGERNWHVANALYNIGRVCSSQDKDEEALEFFKKALKIQRRLLGDEDTCVANSMLQMLSVYCRIKHFEEARVLSEEAAAINIRARRTETLNNGRVLWYLAGAQLLTQGRAVARETVKEAVRIFNKLGIDSQESRGANDLHRGLEEYFAGR